VWGGGGCHLGSFELEVVGGQPTGAIARVPGNPRRKLGGPLEEPQMEGPSGGSFDAIASHGLVWGYVCGGGRVEDEPVPISQIDSLVQNKVKTGECRGV